jgi:excinuclease UvrABC nuclease subunit
MATHGSSSEDDGDDGDDEDSSSHEEVESMVAEYVKKIFKYVKKVNMYDYNVHLRDGRHHQHIKFTRSSTSPRRRWSRRGDQGKKQLPPFVSGQLVENQVLLAQVMNQERTSPPASCKVLQHHYTCALWPKV